MNCSHNFVLNSIRACSLGLLLIGGPACSILNHPGPTTEGAVGGVLLPAHGRAINAAGGVSFRWEDAFADYDSKGALVTPPDKWEKLDLLLTVGLSDVKLGDDSATTVLIGPGIAIPLGASSWLGLSFVGYQDDNDSWRGAPMLTLRFSIPPNNH